MIGVDPGPDAGTLPAPSEERVFVGPADRGVHRLFQAQAAAAPDAVALVLENGSVRYGELDERAERLARRLARRGIGPEARVGICLERCADAVAAMLAALRAGAAFVPLDPAYPAERLAYMLADAGVRTLVTRRDLLPAIPLDGVGVLALDEAEEEAEGADLPAIGVEADALAYVIYTSGSTGRPKGVGVTHRGLRNTALAAGRMLGVDAGSRFLQFASPSFDASVFEVFVALAAGAQLHLAPREALLPGPGLVRLLDARGITHVILPPSALAVLPQAQLAALRTLIVAGEACAPELVRRWARPGRRFVNAYGPTEVAVCATAADCEPDGRTPPIGPAIDGAAAHVLDEGLAPAAEGELYVGGEGVARGYLGRPALTADRFLPDPFSPAPGTRMYRTGDRVRRRADGWLEFVGRMDEQVKVRGHRVEPGEVADALSAHPALAAAAVVARADGPGGTRLVGYVVPGDGAAPPPVGELRAFLARTLPAHMLPAAFVALDALPLTPNGKVDRKALPAPPATRPALAAAYVPPRTEAERRVAGVWTEVLGIEGIGVEDGFLELGGNSLAATQVVSRLRHAHGVEVPLGLVLGGGTVAQAARAAHEAAGDAPAPDPIARAPRGGDLPPSFSQERVWFLTQLAPHNLSYHAHAVLVFRGALDVPALEAALSAVVARHEVLRTTFPTVDGRPVQRIHAPWTVSLPVVDLTDAPAEAREDAAGAWMREDFARRFDLSRLPLVRWALLKTGEDEHRLVHVEHHVIHDGWSFNVLLGDLVQAYGAAVAGRGAALPELEPQFADFCVWQREWMGAAAARAQLDYWTRALAGSSPVLELPTDRPRPAVQGFRGAAPRFSLSAELVRRVRALGHAEGATLFQTMLAGFAVLLSRWSGQDDLSVATAIAARRHPRTEAMMGMFVNAVVLRADLSGDPPVRELLARVRRTTLEAYAHQDLPFEAVVDALRPERTLSHNPLYQVMFSFHDSAVPALALPGVRVEAEVGLGNGSAKFDMNLVGIARADGGLTLVWEYDSDLFDAATVERMFAHYRTLLESAAARPDLPVSRLALMEAGERAAVLRAGDGGEGEAGLAGGVHAWVEAQARRTPGAVAVAGEGGSLTYGELNGRANRLARHLRGRGVGAETRVGVCVERSPGMVVALLAVLKAGAAYLPLDHAHPAERIAGVLRDAGARVLLTARALLPYLPATDADVVLLDDIGESLAREDGDDLRLPVDGESLAYAIYTSGSTGRPKGVMVPHRALAAFLASMRGRPGMSPADTLLAVTTLAFDIAGLELFLPLVCGARVAVASRETAADGAALARALAETGATVMQATPATWRMMRDAGWRGSPGLRVLCGGEAVPADLADALARENGEAWNVYGPTETTIWSTAGRIRPAEAVSVGGPIGGTRVYVLDAAGEPAPPGVPGELWIAGLGVARGYLGRPGLTAERFAPDPFSPRSGARMYRTGDRARWTVRGALEVLGRLDTQVKLRGYRVEPGEIEALLREDPRVRDAVAVVRHDGGAPRLVAYVVPDGAAPADAELRERLSARLPEYMVPAAFVALQALPLNPSGKVDRRALPAPEGGPARAREHVPPRTEAEHALAEAWREVLGVERVGIDDNYFALGGDSIRGVRVVVGARRRGVRISLPQVFRHQTLRALAAAAEPCADAADPSSSAPFALLDPRARGALPDDVEDAYPASRLQLAMLFHTESDPVSPLYLNLHGFRVHAPWDAAAMREALRRTAARHPVLRTSFDLAAAPEPIQRVHRHAEIPLEVADLRGAPEAERARAFDASRSAGFDLARAPLLRLHVHLLDDGVFRMVLAEHHAILDGWSVATLVTELLCLYAALREGTADPTGTPPAARFRDFVALEREAMASAESRAFWRGVVDGAPRTALPPREGDAAEDGTPYLWLDVPAGTAAALRRLADGEGVPLRTPLLAAHLRVLALLAGSDEVVTGCVTSGRPEAEDGERALGLFLNTVPLRVEMGEGTWRGLVRRVRSAEAALLAHRRFPLAGIVREAGGRVPFESGFSFSHFHAYDALAAAGVRVEDDGAVVRTEIPLMAVASVHPATGALRMRLEYDPDRLSPAQARMVGGWYARALDALAADPDAPWDAAPLLHPAQAERLERLAAGRGTEAAWSPVHEAFERRARLAPHAVAVVHAGGTLAYGALNQRANRVAHALRRLGVGPDARVAVCLERGPALVAAILGVLKAGGAYVPLDPAYPAERLARMLAGSGAALLLTDERLRDALPLAPGMRAVCVDALAAEGGASDADAGNPAVAVPPESLAYVIFTSGSTGTPKGVMVSHATLAASQHARLRFYPEPVGAYLLLSPIAFDSSVAGLFWTLCTGGALVLPDGDEAGDPARLQALAERAGVTHLLAVPSLYAQLAAGDGGWGSRLRTAIVAGEACTPELVRLHRLRFGGAALVNEYGPTEATVWSTAHRCGAEAEGAPVPIGAPVEGTRCYVLDRSLRPVAPGVAGELYVGGAQVARGYQRHPGLTAERFLPDPFAAGPGSRMYRTGDRVRWTAGGVLEFLGRLDGQVKIRGFRVETGEVEAALRRHPAVRACAVAARGDGPGETRLAAYVVGEEAPEPGELRAFLRATLPEHMVPASFTRLRALPLLPNGKLDRRALPAPDFGAAAERYVAPRTPREALLAGLWAEVLRVERVGVEDSFFELGGDSIASIQVSSRARRAGVEVTPRQVFEHRTVAALAAALESASRSPASPSSSFSSSLSPSSEMATGTATREAPDGADGPVPVTPAQAWFFAQGHARPEHYNQAVLLAVDGSVGDVALEAALAAVLRHHDALRLRFRRTASGWEQWHGAEAGIALERSDLAALSPGERERAQEELADRRQAGLDLERGPLGRAVLIDRGEAGRVLLLVLHHLVVDGVSWRILRDDLERACAQAEAGTPVDPGAKGTSFQRWAHALEAYGAGGALRDEAGWWLAQGPAGVAPVPLDGEAGGTVADERAVTVRLDAAETHALLHDVPAALGARVNEVLLCALAETLVGWTGGPRVRLALEGHGREEGVGEGIDLTRTVGWLTSLYPLVLDLSGAAGPGERLARVREQLRAVPAGGIGYGVLRWLAPDAEVRGALAAQADPEVVFNYHGQVDQGTGPDARFRFAAGARGRPVALRNRRPHLLAVNGAVRDGCLQLQWSYDEGAHRDPTIERVAGAFLQSLRDLLASARRQAGGRLAAADVPLAGLAQAELDALLGGREGVEDLYPLSPMQEGILFHAVQGGPSQAYQVQSARLLEGPLDVERFRGAWDAVVARHPALRAAFAWRGLRRPLQCVHATAKVPWRVEDWSEREAEAREAALAAYLAEDRGRGFDLERAPLLRCALFRLGAGAHWFVLSQHHLLSDGWSAARVWGEVLALYHAGGAGRAPASPRVRPYRDYVAWLARQDAGAAERYWTGVLAGFATPTPLPAGRAAEPGAEPRNAQRRAALSPALSRRVEQAARRRQVTLNTLLQGAWGVLLARCAGEEDVVFGTTVSGRPAELEGVEEMVGMFINTLPVRMRVPADARLGEWLGELQRAQAEAREYEYTPLVQVQGWSAAPRGAPLFESHFIFESYPPPPAAEGLRVAEARWVEWNTYPLSLMAAPGEALAFALSYDAGRFDAGAIERMLRQLQRVLEQMAGEGDPRLSELELLDEAERRAVLEAGQGSAAAYPADRCIHQLFEAQAARTPDAVAVTFGAAALTYRALDARANQLARHLLRLGVGPEVRVGLCVERSLELMVGLLGVLKAGGAYVPVDPAHPAERIGWVLADSAVAVLLTQERLRASAPVADGIPVLCLDTGWAEIEGEDTDAPRTGVTSENLAYVIYTSGTTGRPKGVAMHHRGVANYIDWGIRHYGADRGNGSPVFSSMAVDLTVTNLLPLFAGKPVHLLPEENAVEALAEAIRGRPGFGAIKITPVHLALLTPLLTAEEAREAAHTLVIGADFLPAEPTVFWQDQAPGVRLMNEYGPTETVVGCSAYLLPNGIHRHGPVPVGGPIQNLAFYVLDGRMRPVPIGLPGELYIGGTGVARGYLGRPGLSAEKFVPDPFAGGGARMYRTGDRARWLEGGALMVLGRTDSQVKIRGYRVELGEVEAVLRRQEGVSGALAVVREDVPGDRRLVAYVVGGAEPEALRERLRATLPEYMVPGAFVRLESLPRTATGKIDPKTLPAPEYGGGGEGSTAPRTPVEEVMAGIWAEVLGLDEVGVDEDFFALGGQSLLAMRVVSRVREVLAVEMPVRVLFETLTVAAFAQRVEALRRAELPPLPSVVPVDRGRPIPLSFAQERLWFLDRLESGSAFYNAPFALRLRGPLDAPALERALGHAVRRHEALRTVFAEAEGGPVQVILPFEGFGLPVEDVAGGDEAEREAEALRLAADEAVRPFDLAAGPLFRARLLRLAADDHVLLLCMHHVASDAWSAGVLFRELSAAYEAGLRGEEPRLDPLPVQYADYAVWQREQLRGETLDRQVAYWKEVLAGAPALLELPADHPRPAAQSFRGATERAALPAALLDRLRAVGREEGATLFMVLLAAFQALLSRYAGTDDVVVGSPVAGRTRGETEGLIGIFLNTLVLRTDLGGDPGFREALRRVREATLGAREHQDVPFERLVEALQPARSLSHSPLFQVMFSLEDGDALVLRLPRVRVEAMEAHLPVTKFDLELACTADADGLRAGLVYSTDLFDADTAARMLAHLGRVLEQVADDPGVRLSRLALAGAEERRQVVETWNRTDAPFPDASVHALFAEQARRTPDALAVEWGGERLTYAALDARAGAVARRLAALGVGPEVRVGVLLERGPEMVVAVLAVLGAGGCCVPVDTSYPPGRMALMLADSGARVLLTRSELAAAPGDPGIPVLCLDGPGEEAPAGPAEAPAPRVAGGNLAYVFYTSGSTGRPKGVMMQHREVVQYVAGLAACMPIGPGDRVAQASNASFDAAVFEMWGALLYGGTLVGIDRDVLLSASQLGRALRERGITHLYQTAALFNQHVREQVDVYASLRQLVFGAEAVGTESVRRMLRDGRPARVLHEYGPTEATVWCTLHPLESLADDAPTVPIGRPIPNARALVLDAALQPLPPGVPGELYVGGAGVVRGYLGRPALTAERFVPDPFAAEPGARMYRTGDRVRWKGDGTLEFGGRLDDQVKIRGFRIEPGEVEGALAALPGVRQARVVVREDRPGDKALVAYVVGAADPDALRAQLRLRLPEYMVPRAFVALERLPLTPNGKLDRAALPAPADGPAEGAYAPPRTPVEEVLAGMWAELLGRARVGVDEGFFELGGHSLLATRLVSRIRQAFGVEVPVRALFEAPTVAGLAGRVEALRGAGQAPPPPIVPMARGDAAPLSFAQERLWFLHRMEPESAFYNVPAALRLRGALDARALERAMGEVVRRHESLRTVFPERDGVPAQVAVPFAVFALPVDDLSALEEEAREAEVRRRATDDAARPFDLAAGPPFRARLLRLADEDHVLLLCMHHVVSDAWSMGVLFRELAALYAGFRDGAEPALAALPVRYADYAAWQRDTLRGAVLDGEVAWWRERLAGAPELLELPADRPRPAAQAYRGASVCAHVPAGLVARLEAVGRGEGATLYMVLLAAFQALLGRYAGRDDVVVGTTLAGRTHAETEGLIGLFMNTLPLRTDLSGDPDFREAVRRVREVTLGAWEHQGVPFEKLVEALRPERSLSHAPVFQVLFELNNAGGGAALDGVDVHPVNADAGTAKLDLALGFRPAADGLAGAMVYSTDLFDRTTVERMLAHYLRVLEQAAADPRLRLSELDLLDEAQRWAVLDAGQGSAAAYPADRCIHQLFEAQAARTPDAVAVTFGGAALTYRVLDGRANRLARHLLRLGVGPEVRVGLCVERSLELMVGLLGVLKAGGAYVPVDPAHPAERIGWVLADSTVAVLLTQERLRASAPVPDGIPVLCLDTGWGEIEGEDADAPRTGVTSENLAYVIYTSGTTGRPKGVAMHHRGVANYIGWGIRHYGADRGNGSPVFSSMAVDLTVTNLLPLFAGKPVHLLPEENAVEALAEAIRGRPGFGAIKITPVHLALLTPLLTPEEAREAAHTLVIGADFLPAEPTVFWQDQAPGVRLMNEYGPTETVVGCSAYLLPNGVHRHGPVPVGGPIQNLAFYVLDGRMRPVPIGLPGELYIGGAGVARGYLGRSALSAEKFVPDPFAGGGARMYRTGDRARWLEGGALTILGRTDSQVKVRGYRVELGEVEAVLRRQEGVSGALAVVREDVPGDRRLVAYVVGGAEPEALRERLRATLPEYMVPGAFVRLDALPRTATGKIDPKTLPAPEYGGGGEGSTAPRTPVEEVMAGIWAEVLGVDEVGVDEDFFALGGHSLLAIRVVSAVRDALAVELPLRALFEGPTVARLAERVEVLRRVERPPLAPIVPVGRTGPLPLSFAQERLWFLDRLQPGSPLYNVPAALRLRGPLDAPALERALGQVVRRHEVLRTVFPGADGAPVQVIVPFEGFGLPMEDVAGGDEVEREAEALRVAADEAVRPFDLAAGPLFRARLFRLADEDHVLLLGMHHGVTDGWSMGVLFDELSALYAAYREGTDPSLPGLPVQYADYAVWQREQLRGDALDAEIAWWKARLAGAPALLELPTDHPRPAVQSPRGAVELATFPPALLHRLRAVGRGEGATLYMVLLGAFQVLLGRYAGTADVVVGSATAGRGRGETAGLIGFFVNTLALRTELGGDPHFREVLRRVREATLGAWEHQDVPFERLVAELHPERGLSHSPLFQVSFALDEARPAAPAFAGLESERLAAGEGSAKFDLALELAADAHGLRAALGYRADLFEPGTVRRMLGHLARVLEQVADDPGRRISALELLAGEERRLVVDGWAGTERARPAGPCVHERCEAWAARTPDAPAVVFAGRTLTYAALDRGANRLARWLRRHGVGPDTRVGVCLERGPELIGAALAVMKAGGAYVALDPAYPAERLAALLADSGAALLLTREALAAGLPLPPHVRVLCVDAPADEVAAEAGEPLPASATPRNLAYVIYTSGSTGAPKGVAVEHAGLGSLCDWHAEAFAVTPADRATQLASPGFDASAWEVWPYLSRGACVEVVPDAVRGDPAALRDWLVRAGITLAFVPTPLAEPMLALEWPQAPALRRLLTGGDRLRARPGAGLPFVLVNNYGPTECTVVATSGDVPPDEGRAPSIGVPIHGVRCHVLDPALCPLPAGVPGELYVGGAQVARGYLGRPGMTADRFVPDPFAAAPGARIYRTGDRARWLPDGTLEFLGRLDDQVKLRGFRIEPGEVEAVLRRHAGVRECVVVVREDAAGDKRLAAYATGPADADELRAHLRRGLPPYMVPTAVVKLDALPLTPAGKLDRRALPAPAAGGPRRRMPGTGLEARLAALWEEVLGVEGIGVDDSFFDLGGHSLLLVRLQARLAAELGEEVRVVELFQFPTVRALTGRLRGAREADAAEEGEGRGGVRQAGVALRQEAARRRRGTQ